MNQVTYTSAYSKSLATVKSILRPIRDRFVYTPRLIEPIEDAQFLSSVADFFAIPLTNVAKMFIEYKSLSLDKAYASSLGEEKTLCLEEAFVTYVILCLTRPKTIIEIGTEYGGSTRRIIDMKVQLELDAEVVCFDVVNKVKHFEQNEARLVLKDLTHSFKADVLEALHPGFIYLDAHPYHLLRNIIKEVMNATPSPVLAIHDCTRGLCNPRMRLDKNDFNITSGTGVWERYVLAELFGISDPRSRRLDNYQTPRHSFRVFRTRHGLGVLYPRTPFSVPRADS
jgi:hypothetical protein